MAEFDDDGEFEEPQSPGRPGLPVDPARVFRALRKRWRVIVTVAALSSITGVVLAKTVASKTFVSRAVITWERGGRDSRQELRTLVDSMLIPVNLMEVKRRTKSQMPLEALALTLDVFFDPNSDVVSIEASAATALGAKTLADTVVAVFLDHCAQLRRSRAEAALQEIRTNLDVARATLASAQEVYDAFRRENNITNLSAESNLAIQNAASLRSMADAARSEALSETARAKLLEQNARGERAMVVTGQTQSDPNAAAAAALRTELTAARARLSADHPRIAALEAQLQAAQAAGQGSQGIVSTGQNAHLVAMKSALAESSTARAAALERQQVYAERAAEAREQLQKLSAIEGQAAVLLSEVTNAASQVAGLEAQLTPAERAVRDTSADFRVLAPAELPPHASSGKGKVYAAGIPAAAMGLLMIVLLWIDLQGLRIRTAREAAFWINGPVIGTSVWPRDPALLSELLDELADCAQHATGDTLIVGAAPGDEGAASEIARGLRQRLAQPTRATPSNPIARGLLDEASTVGERTTLAEIAAPPSTIAKGLELRASKPPTTTDTTSIRSWDSTQHAISLRRASRLSDRVVVVLTSDTMAMPRLSDVPTRLGRDHGTAVLVVGVDPALSDLPDRVGDVDGFWFTNDYEAEA